MNVHQLELFYYVARFGGISEISETVISNQSRRVRATSLRR